MAASPGRRVQVIMDYDKNVAGSQGNGVVDPSLLVMSHRAHLPALGRRESGVERIRPALTRDGSQFVLNHSMGRRRHHMTAPVSITSQIKTPWRFYQGLHLHRMALSFSDAVQDAAAVARSNLPSKDRSDVTTVPAAIPAETPHPEAQLARTHTATS
jgi:hypothetical protein